ncbi:MAG: RNA polymerase sigma factor [Actinomycetota bacterium]
MESTELLNERRAPLLELYDDALEAVYGYLYRRCRSRGTAEDLTTETFLAALQSIDRGVVDTVTVAWLVGIARHKLIDHWRGAARADRLHDAIAAEQHAAPATSWDADLDQLIARDVLADLDGHHRAALTLRYVDDLPVREVADVLDRTEGATEQLLVRARRAFRQRYEEVAQ